MDVKRLLKTVSPARAVSKMAWDGMETLKKFGEAAAGWS
jgi:hypothetical protein